MTKKAKRMLALMDRATTLWHIPVVGRAKGRIIRRVIERHGSARGIEIGTLIGYSAILIASAMPPKGRLVCVEVDAFLTRLADEVQRWSAAYSHYDSEVRRLRNYFKGQGIDPERTRARDLSADAVNVLAQAQVTAGLHLELFNLDRQLIFDRAAMPSVGVPPEVGKGRAGGTPEAATVGKR